MVHKAGSIRIIGGRWRSRTIKLLDFPGLRPSTDRIRETLFNWLQTDIVGAVCLDLFAGSGALGFEALSRGAKHVTFVDASSVVLAGLEATAAELAASDAEFILGECPSDLPQFTHGPFDVVFVDPPFQQGLLAPSLCYLSDSGLLKKDALVYIEAEIALNPLPVPEGWTCWRHKHTATLQYALYRV